MFKRKQRQLPRHHAQEIAGSQSPLAAISQYAADRGYGFYLGPLSAENHYDPTLRFGRPENALLVLGPPREGKTTSLVIPQVLACPGPLLTTSTKLDVFRATAMARSFMGRVWVYDPMNTEPVPAGATELRWSPIEGGRRWDEALKRAMIMVETARPSEGVRNSSFWGDRAAMFLAAVLHLAAIEGATMRQVTQWLAVRDIRALLESTEARMEGGAIVSSKVAPLAVQALMSMSATMGSAPEEAAGVIDTAETVLKAYSFEAAQRSCDPPGRREDRFSPDEFVRSCDTIYVAARSRDQRMVAPLVVGLLDSIVEATFAAHRRGDLTYRTRTGGLMTRPVSFILDEAANIAPIPSLPDLASLAGGQGLLIAAYFQDFSQPLAIWGERSKGFWTLFGEKVILRGIAHKESLDLISTLIGKYYRIVTSRTESTQMGLHGHDSSGFTENPQLVPILDEHEVSKGPPTVGFAGMEEPPFPAAWHCERHIEPNTIEATYLTPWFYAPPWPEVLTWAFEHYHGQALTFPPLEPNDVRLQTFAPEACRRFVQVWERRRQEMDPASGW